MHFVRSRAEEKSTETRVDKPTEIEYSRVLKSLFQQVFTKQTYFFHTYASETAFLQRNRSTKWLGSSVEEYLYGTLDSSPGRATFCTTL